MLHVLPDGVVPGNWYLVPGMSFGISCFWRYFRNFTKTQDAHQKQIAPPDDYTSLLTIVSSISRRGGGAKTLPPMLERSLR